MTFGFLWRPHLVELGFFSVDCVVAEAIDLMHPLVQDRHDADVAVREAAPVNDVALLAEVEALDPELGPDRFRDDAPAFDPVERREQFGDVSLGLLGAPAVTGVAVDVVEAVGRGRLDPDGHAIRSGCAR